MEKSSKLLNKYLDKMTYVGELEVIDNTINWHRNRDIKVSKIKDVVYFMMVDGKLYKIGKTECTTGWLGRVQTYASGEKFDHTNARIIRVMNEDNLLEHRIKVYVLEIPRKKVEFECPATGDIITDDIPMAKNMEWHLTKKFINEGYELKFCNQL